MNKDFYFGRKRVWAATVGVLMLCAALSCRALGRQSRASHDSGQSDTRATALSVNETSAAYSGSRLQVKNFFLDFAGDHSLNAATVIEQAIAGYASYTVQLRLASGAEQSVVVAAPPGGLQVEMHDMTGDHVPNDVVLRPALFRWLPTVLVNDGHDHYAVVVSGTDPGSFSLREDFGARPRDGQTFAFLRSSGFKAVHLPQSKRLLVPRMQQSPLTPFSEAFARTEDHAASSGRAPPFPFAV